ncbi:hypothetical protein GQ55_2G242900 [Panicum hallii var. hallii]|uniref:Uncharacterized protein n=1 Tax=Panicum hallii var. hallii TaxID=1504633 RepID=A0A2T7ERY1_9POAL|nr:hypothetical protein GQ55_2G242900 [Panicum hallii var. hallii]
MQQTIQSTQSERFGKGAAEAAARRPHPAPARPRRRLWPASPRAAVEALPGGSAAAPGAGSCQLHPRRVWLASRGCDQPWPASPQSIFSFCGAHAGRPWEWGPLGLESSASGTRQV